MLISWLIIIIGILGLLIYAFTEGKPSEIGRLMFACALLALCFVVGGKTVRLF